MAFSMLLTQDQNPASYIIQQFEAGLIKINDQWHTQSLALSASHLHPIQANTLEELDFSMIEPVLAWQPQILLLGTGPNMKIPSGQLLGPIFESKIGVEFMDSSAASRTFHVLTSEQRQVAAILLIQD